MWVQKLCVVMSCSPLHSSCINRAWQPLLQCCWVYPCNTSMKYWCFACVGWILKQIYVCEYFTSRGKSYTHTHTHRRREKHIANPDLLGKKKTLLNIHLALLCWAQNVPFLIWLLLAWGPGLQWSAWFLLLGLSGWAQQQALPEVEHGLRNLHHMNFYRPV